MHEYRQIIVRMRLGETNRAISRSGCASRNKLRAVRQVAIEQGWLDPHRELPDNDTLAQFLKSLPQVIPHPSSVSCYRQQIEEWHRQGIQATTMHAALQRQYGFTGAYNAVQRLVKSIKDKAVEVTTILEFKPGECAQVDFGAGPKIVDEKTGEHVSTWIFVMVLAFSRHMYAEIVFKQDVETWLGCHRRAFEWFGGVPKKITIDNAKCAITKACYYDPVVQRAYSDYAEGYGFIISACPPREPKKKGRVEAGVKYVKKNFLPLREFSNLTTGNQQLKTWLLEIAGNRVHGSTREKPLTLYTQTERLVLKPLPNNPPECAVWAKVLLHGDCHVQYLKCRYSAPYQLVKQHLWLRATETTIRLYNDHTLIAVHSRLFKPGSRNTIPEHLPPNALAYCMQDPQWCLLQAAKIGPHCQQVIQALLEHSVVDYLRAAQGIIGLHKTYGNARLDAACKRALVFQSPQYRTIKSILKTGAEYNALPEQDAFDTLAETYTGKSRFCRDTSTLQ